MKLFIEGLEGRSLPSVQFTPAAYTIPAHLPDQALGDFSGGFAPVEPTLSVNALDPAQINVSSQAGIRVSTTTGRTFTSPAFFSGSGGGDTSTAYDGAGRLFWVNLGGPGILISQVNPTTGAVIPGTTFTVDNGGGFDDKEFLAADALTNNLYVVWTRFTDTGGTAIDIRRSTNQGRTWSPLVEVDNGFDGFTWPATVAVAPDGHVFVAYHSVLNFVNNAPDNSGKVVVVRFNNDLTSPLRTFSDNPGFADITFNVQTAGSARIIPHMQFWTQGAAQPQILVDPVRPGNIYVVSADSNNVPNDPMDVRIARSTDDGQFWTTSLIDTGPNASAQLFPQAAIDPFGDIVVAYYDNRRGLVNPNGNDDLDVFAKYSIDGGQTWSPAFQVNGSTNAFDPDPGAIHRFNGPPPTTRIGEYFGLGLFGGTAYVAWNGNTFGDIGPMGQQVWFNQFAIRGALTVTGTTGNDTITIQNLASNAADVAVLVNGQQQYVGLWSALTGITIAATSGNDTINIEDVQDGTPITVNLGNGTDIVNISPTARSLGTIQAAITVHGGMASTLNVDDQNGANGDFYTLTANSVQITGSAPISYGSLGMNVTINGSGSMYNIFGTEAGFNTVLHTGLSAIAVNVQAASGPLTIDGDGGQPTVNFGSQAPALNGTLAGITAQVTVTNSTGALNVDDSGDATNRTGLIRATEITSMGLGVGGGIFYNVRSSLLLSSLTVHGGSGRNTYTVAATPTSAGGTTTLDTGNGTDTVDVEATTQPLTVNLDGPGTINVGDTSGRLNFIQGTVTLNHLVGPGSLHVNDEGSTAAQTYILNAGSVTRTGASLISYLTSLFSVFVNGGQGSNVYDVNGTENLLVTTLNINNGNDTVNVKATTGPLTVNPGSGTDMVNVGDTANTLNEIQGVVTVNGRGSDTVNMFDQGSTTPHTYTLTASSMTRGPGGPTINFPNCRAVLHRGVTGGGSPTPPGANIINVLATDPNAPVDIVADNGDIVNVGNDTDGLDEIQGALSIDGGDGTVPLNLNDQMTASGQLYDLLPGELDRSGAAPITFQNLQQEILNGGGNGNTFDVDGVAEGCPVTVNTGVGDGNLVRMRRHDLIQDALILNGQGPSDRVGYVAYTTDVYINLLTGVATDLASFTGFHDVTGGQANNIIVADDSEDTINGNLPDGSAGQDLIITGGSTGGGMGTVYGSGNGDILIGGSVSYASDPEPQAMTELQAILAEWTRTDLSYADRVAHVINGDDPLDPYPLSVAAGTVSDNGDQYNLIGHPGGAPGLNLYYVTNGDTDDANGTETVINLSGNVSGRAFPRPTGGTAGPAQAPTGNASSGQLANPAAPAAGVFLGGQRSAASDQPASIARSSGISADLPAVADNGDLTVAL